MTPSASRIPGAPQGNQLSYSFRVIGGHRPGVRDAYHAFLKMPWWGAIAAIVSTYLILNALFALLYMATGGVAHAAKHSFLDAFFFSVQTMGTIGYGAMYPETRLANTVMVAESVAGLLLTAIATGIVFVKFSQTRGKILFSERVAIGPLDGIPTLMLRLGNERNNSIYDADMRLTLIRTRRTAEGLAFYENQDLKLVKDRAHALPVVDDAGPDPSHGPPWRCRDAQLDAVVAAAPPGGGPPGGRSTNLSPAMLEFYTWVESGRSPRGPGPRSKARVGCFRRRPPATNL